MSKTIIQSILESNPGLKDKITQSQISVLEENDLLVFLDLLVMTITGYSLSQVQEDKQQEILTECVNFYLDSIEEYLQVNDRKDYIQFKTIRNANQKVDFDMNRFDNKIQEAHEFFINSVLQQ